MRAAVKEFLQNMGSSVVDIYNEYCEKNNYGTDIKLVNFDLDECLAGQTPTDILKKCKDLKLTDTYFYVDEYNGYLHSFEFMEDVNCPIDYSDLADYIIKHDECFHNSKLRWFLDAFGSSEQEEDEE